MSPVAGALVRATCDMRLHARSFYRKGYFVRREPAMLNPTRRNRWRLFLVLAALMALIGCDGPSLAPVDPYATAPANGEPAPPLASAHYLDQVSFAPQDAKFFALVDQRLT